MSESLRASACVCVCARVEKWLLKRQKMETRRRKHVLPMEETRRARVSPLLGSSMTPRPPEVRKRNRQKPREKERQEKKSKAEEEKRPNTKGGEDP